MGFEGLEVNSPSGCAIFLSADNHAVTPCNRFPDWHGFEDSQSHISVQASFDCILPMEGYWYG